MVSIPNLCFLEQNQMTDLVKVNTEAIVEYVAKFLNDTFKELSIPDRQISIEWIAKTLTETLPTIHCKKTHPVFSLISDMIQNVIRMEFSKDRLSEFSQKLVGVDKKLLRQFAEDVWMKRLNILFH